jgi:hypothetical protein
LGAQVPRGAFPKGKKKGQRNTSEAQEKDSSHLQSSLTTHHGKEALQSLSIVEKTVDTVMAAAATWCMHCGFWVAATVTRTDGKTSQRILPSRHCVGDFPSRSMLISFSA